MPSNKMNRETIFYGLCVLFFLFMFCLSVSVSINRSWPDLTPSQITVTENEEASVVSLCVVKKVWLPGPTLISFFGRYYIILSNDMIVDVSAREFEEYEENKYYSFESIEKTVVTNRIRTKK